MQPAFDSTKYIHLQTQEILERLDKFPRGKLYFEVGGKFLYDGHAERVLPGFDPESKIKILENLKTPFEIIFCVSSPEIQNKRVWKHGETYQESVLNKLQKMKARGLPLPQISVNLYNGETETQTFMGHLNSMGYKCHIRYYIDQYPTNVESILSSNGYGRDEHIETSTNLVIVMGLGSNSGKMSTCLGQIFHDKNHNQDSGYAKYETFPIWNLPLEHPVNLAYEAATADIGDRNAYDHFHEEAYGKKAVNYNRDIEAFPILQQIIDKLVSKNNYMRKYKSPTDMGISTAKKAFIDEEKIIKAAIQEIKARIQRYQDEYSTGFGQVEWVERCEKLLEKALEYKS